MDDFISSPNRLRCEYLVNPFGVDTPSPRFSWYIKHEKRGEGQRAYQIIVSSLPEKARAENGDVWDSGQVEGEDNYGASYDGPPFISSTVYYWRIRWWDRNGRVSPFSHIAFFQTGILNPEEWKASWVGPAQVTTFTTKGSTMLGVYLGDVVQTHAIYLRKEFTVSDQVRVKQARAYVCGLGFSEFRLNGEKVGGRVLDPAQTDYSKIALYTTKNLTKSLRVGPNVAGLILGNGRFIKSNGFGSPKAFVQIEIDYVDGTREVIGSDATWKSSGGGIQENGIYSGEVYNALEEKDGWDDAGFDDSGWTEAVLRESSPLASQMAPPIRVNRILTPQKLSSPAPGVYIFDFGQNYSGWIRLKASGPAGTEIRVRHGELVNEDGTLNTSPNQNAESRDIYILQGSGMEAYEPHFTYHGFRYVEITGFPGVPSLDSIEGCFVHSDVDSTGDFHCSHELITRIHQSARWGQLSNLMSVPTDCPQRDERHGWLGDAHLSAEEAIFNFDMSAFYSKYLEDIRLAQRDDGSLPDVVPPYLPNLYPADPAWGSAYATLAWLMYQYYGDKRVLERHFPALKKYVQFLTGSANRNIIENLGKYGDWCPPGSIPPKKTPLALTSTWYYYHDVLTLSRIAKELGLEDEVRTFSRMAEEIKGDFNRAFLTDEGYATGKVTSYEKTSSQTSNLLPLHLDMVPQEKKERVLQKLLESIIQDQDYHLDTGILGTRYILDVLTEHGFGDTAFKVATQKTYPGWGYMIEEGATTLWERWEKITGGGMNSHNHIMLGSIDAWFYRAIAGVSCLAPGWKKLRLRPYLFPGLTFATARLHTIRGEIHASWERSDNAFQLFALVPVGAEAEVNIPLLWDKSVLYESGVPIWESGKSKRTFPEISLGGQINGRLALTTGSGFYAFTLSPVT